MKKTLIISLIAASAMATTSCSDFLDRLPMTEPNNETYLSTENQVRSYINGLYMAIPTFNQYGLGVRAEEKNSDNILAEQYDERLNGEFTNFSGASDWSTGYQNLRDVNYFFHYYTVSEDEENDNLRSLRGEAHFLRAYWHFYLLKRFGNIPLMDAFWDENATIEGLQIPQKPRNEVAKFILQDLTTAKGLLHGRSEYKGLRINKEAAMILAMNVALYEGSWEKYHANDAFAAQTNESEYFFNQVITWGDELFQAGITLNTKDTDPFGATTPADAFAHMFNQKDYSNVPEAVFWKKYSMAEGVYNSVVPSLAGGIVDTDGAAGLSKSLVDNYLNADGTFINPTDAKYKDFNVMFENRDPRLTETVMSTGHKFRSATITRPMCVKEFIKNATTDEEKQSNAEILSPYLNGDGNGRNLTGFHTALGVDTTYTRDSFWDTGLVIFRYSEALLAYAEAAEELKKCDDTVLEKTLKLLRERAGVTYVKPNDMGKDPHFSDFGYELTPNMQEIRRERRSELALQGFRLDDLMRWKGEKLIVNQRGRGAYLGHDGVLYKSFNTSDTETANALGRLLTDVNGWLDPLQGRLPNGYQFHADRDYLMPISPDELALNKLLKQNPNW